MSRTLPIVLPAVAVAGAAKALHRKVDERGHHLRGVAGGSGGGGGGGRLSLSRPAGCTIHRDLFWARSRSTKLAGHPRPSADSAQDG